MNAAFLVQLLISGVAVAALIGLSAWIGVPRVKGAMTEDQVRAVMAEEHPEWPIDRISVEAGGRSALVTSGDTRLLIKRVGDGHVVLTAPPADIVNTRRTPAADAVQTEARA